MDCATKRVPSMGCPATDPLQELIDDANALNLFGKFKPEHFIDQEEQERERKFKEAQKEREKAIRRQAKKEMQEEMEFKKYLQKEEMKARGSESSGRVVGRGRASRLQMPITRRKPQGHGCLPLEGNGAIPYFDREERVQKHLSQLDAIGLHSNAVQKIYWRNVGGSQNKENEEDLSPSESYSTLTDVSASMSDQYEDAENSSASQSFTSAPSQASASPQLMDEAAAFPLLEPSPPSTPRVESSARPRKPRGSRLAARFTNKLEDDETHSDVNCYPDGKDMLEELCPRPMVGAVKYTASRRLTGVTFNSLNPSNRELNVRHEKLYSESGACGGFHLDNDEFPPL